MVPLEDETILNHTHKAGSWDLLGVLRKISDEHPRPFYMGVFPQGYLPP